MGCTMTRPARTLLVLGTAALAYALTGSGAGAQFCLHSADCPDSLVCNNVLPGFFGTCGVGLCNSDAGCVGTAQPSICELGVCQATCVQNANCPPGQVCAGFPGRHICVLAPQPTAPPPPSGIPLAGEGQACGPRNLGGGVIKTIPCRARLRCVHGFCERPLR